VAFRRGVDVLRRNDCWTVGWETELEGCKVKQARLCLTQVSEVALRLKLLCRMYYNPFIWVRT